VVIATDCIGSHKSNYHTITTKSLKNERNIAVFSLKCGVWKEVKKSVDIIYPIEL
jgi:hypothetical protein